MYFYYYYYYIIPISLSLWVVYASSHKNYANNMFHQFVLLVVGCLVCNGFSSDQGHNGEKSRINLARPPDEQYLSLSKKKYIYKG